MLQGEVLHFVMQGKIVPLTYHLPVEVDIHIGGFTQVRIQVRQPVRGVDQIDNAKRDITDLPLIGLTE
ncbi:hypothetical protein D3C75_939640 [compost metagenome]